MIKKEDILFMSASLVPGVVEEAIAQVKKYLSKDEPLIFTRGTGHLQLDRCEIPMNLHYVIIHRNQDGDEAARERRELRKQVYDVLSGLANETGRDVGEATTLVMDMMRQ